jgi:hypothetical protein
MRTVTLENGVLHLRSDEASQMFEHLASNGLVFEYLSALFDERANGVSADELKNIKGQLTSVQEQLGRLERMISLSINSGAVANFATAPVVDKAESSIENTEVVVKKPVIDRSKLSGSADNAFSKMKRFGKTK